MRVRGLGVTLLATAALAAVFASSAAALPVTPESKWMVAGAALGAGKTKNLQCSVFRNLILTGKVFAQEVEIEASAAECPAGAVIEQEGFHAIEKETLKLTGLTVLKPAACTTAAAITTKALVVKSYLEKKVIYTKFEPAMGTLIAEVPLTGALCAIEGLYALKGTVFALPLLGTNEEALDQTLSFSSTIQTNGGGAMTLGPNPAQLFGEIKNVLNPAEAFGVHE